MKQFASLFIAIFFLSKFSIAQNVGIGIPAPQQALDVNGSIKISGAASTNIKGTIRYNAGKFEGADGTTWKSFDNIPKGTIILSTSYPNTTLDAAGFSFLTSMKGDINTPSTVAATANSWQPASAGLSARSGAQSVWTGSNVIIWGGYNSSGQNVNDGAIYNATNDSWTPMSNTGAPSPRGQGVVIWTGTEMLVWGGYLYNGSFTYYNDGAKYNPTTDKWTAMNTTGAPTGRGGCAFAWTGTEVVIWGGNNGTGALTDGAKYNPATNTWSTMNTTVNPGQRFGFGQSASTTDLYIWGGFYGSPLVVNGYKYNFAANAWTILPTTGTPPTGKNGPLVKWTGSKLIVWGGASSDANTNYNTGSIYDPATSSWTAMTNSTITSFGQAGAVIFNNKFYTWGVTGGQYYDIALNTWGNYPSSSSIRTNRNGPIISVTDFGFLSWGGQQYGALSTYLPYFDDGERFFVNATGTITVNTPGVQLFYLYVKN